MNYQEIKRPSFAFERKRQGNQLAQQQRLELEKIIYESFPLAWRLLKTEGEFMPYAAIQDHRDDISYLCAPKRENESERLSYQGQIDYITETLKSLAKEQAIKAAAVIFHGQVKLEKATLDSITFALEDIKGASLRVYFPYKLSIIHGLNIKNPLAKKAKSCIFA